MEKESECKLVLFENRFECFLQDGSILEKTGDVITYYSTKGNKVRVG